MKTVYKEKGSSPAVHTGKMALVLKLSVVYGAVLVNLIPVQGKICVVEYKRLIMYGVVTF